MIEYSDEMIDKLANKLCEEIAQKELKKMVFITAQQDDVMKKIYKWLNEDKKRTINNESTHHYPSQYPITSEEFNMLFENILDYTNDNELYYTEDFIFPNIYINFTYQNLKLRFFQMSGQGTFRCICVPFGNEWKEDKAFTYDKYKQDIFTENE